MATLIAYQSGDWTGATTWKEIATGTGSSQTARTGGTGSSVNYVYSPTFTITNGQVIEGVLLYVRRNSTTGTFSVALSDDNGTTATREVTVDTADLPSEGSGVIGSWVFFKFASTLTADGGNDYRVGVKSSSAITVQVMRSGTTADWTRIFRRSDTASIAGTDNVYICDELTGQGTKDDIEVTMDSTSSATTYGAIEIGQGGVLSYGTSASTNYHLKLAGNINVRSGGTFNIGTTGTPIPRTSTAKLEFASASAAQYGLEVLEGGTFNAQGLSRTSGNNSYYCLLNTDEAVNSTSLGVDTDTGWLDNDRIVLSATGSVLAEYEVGTLNGNAGASTLTVDGFGGSGGGLAFAHSGTAPTQAEVALLTRNVEIFGASRTNTTYLLFQTTATVDMDWVYLKWIGSNTTFKLGIDALTREGSCNIQYCVIEETLINASSFAFRVAGSSSNNVTFSNNVVYNVGGFGVSLNQSTSGTSFNISNNIIIGVAWTALTINDTAGTFDGNRISGATELAVSITDNGEIIGSFDGNIIHNNRLNGVAFNTLGTISNCKIWHNNLNNVTGGCGLNFNGASRDWVYITNSDFYGNRDANVLSNNGVIADFDNCTFGGTTTLSSAVGFNCVSAKTVTFQSCTFRTTSGIYAAHTTADVNFSTTPADGRIVMNNCLLGATTEVVNQSNLRSPSYFGSQKHDQTAGQHRAWKRFGTITTDSTIYKTASPSERLTPNDASGKLESGTKLVAIENATTKTISVWVRESVVGDGTDYNGNRPRLRYRRSDAAGVTTDGTLDTATASAEGDWEQLSGTSPAITDDAVLEFYVDCDGTAGWVNVDDWTVS